VDTLLVTGGAGFIGANVVRAALAGTDWRVVVLDALTYAGHRESLADVERDPRFAFVRGDVADPDAVESVFRAHEPRYVLHLAAESHVDRSIDGPREFVRTNVVGTHEMLVGARAHVDRRGAAERERFRFVHVSTDEVFGALGPTGRFDERSPHAPRSPYAASKAGADHLAAAYHETYGLPVLVTNCSNNYGPWQFPEKLIPLMALTALEGRPLPVYGDGRQVRDWLHVEDHAAGLLAALRRGRPGERYLFGGEAERTNLEVVEAICEALERRRPARDQAVLASRGIARWRDLVTHVADRPGHDRRYAVDASKARRDLGWAPTRSFASGIDATVGWYLDHAAWCEAVQDKGYRRERLGVLPPRRGETTGTASPR
jgi:dTDP-glucose 4,6-dehydratase